MMANWGVHILGTFLQAGLLGLWLLAAVLILRPRPRWRTRLLMAGLVPFLVPAVFTFPLTGPARVAALVGPFGEAAASSPIDLLAVLGAARLAGLGVGSLLLARAALGLRRTLAAAEKVDVGPVHDALRDVAEGQGVATPRLFLTGSAGPGAIGIRRPAILLPRRLARSLDPDALRMVLAHEVAHIARRDPLAAAVRRLALALWWFHPVAWVLARMHRAAAEDACDDVAAAHAGPDAYCGALLACAGAAAPAPLAVALGDPPLARRFRRLIGADGHHPHGLLDRLARRFGPDAAAGLLVAIAAAAVIAAPIRFVAFQRPPDHDVVVRSERIVHVHRIVR